MGWLQFIEQELWAGPCLIPFLFLILWGEDFLNPHFIDEEGEAQRVENLSREAHQEEVEGILEPSFERGGG